MENVQEGIWLLLRERGGGTPGFELSDESEISGGVFYYKMVHIPSEYKR